MGGGGSSTADTKTTTQNLTPEQKALVGLAMPSYQEIATSNPTLPGAAGVAGFDPLQTQGQNMVLGQTGTQGDIVGSAGQGNKFLTSGAALDPDTNPALQKTIDAAVDPIYRNLTHSVLPGIGSEASTGAGGISANFGGSRHGIAEGMAIDSANRTAGATAAPIANAGYQSGLGAMNTAIGQSNAVAGGQTLPGVTTSTVGDVRQQQAQAGMTADQAAAQFAWMLPFLKAQTLTSGAGSLPGGSTTAVGTGNTNPSGLQQGLGIASAGAGILGGLGAAGGSAGIAGLLPLLAMSDRRQKENIEPLGIVKGLKFYAYNFKGSAKRIIGVMADELRKVLPDAVFDLNGVEVVNYSRVMEVVNGR